MKAPIIQRRFEDHDNSHLLVVDVFFLSYYIYTTYTVVPPESLISNIEPNDLNYLEAGS
jgi:hypothetical protein